jgi:LmbE family N-acetylglucosaminyl deacetylase/AmiR/NasT family two-component response regulator
VSSPGEPESPGRILVVEDDPEAAAYVLHVLRNRGGFEVIHIANPASALDRARAERWDLVLTDVEMPGMTGIELLEAVREISPQLPVAVVTAHPSVDYAVRALRNKADEFLEKPVRPDKLLGIVTALVGKGRAAREAARQSVLAIGAHPDDVEIGAAGTLAMHRRLGHEVSILTLSRGARGGTEDTRATESRKAAEVIGATLYHEDLQDTSIREGDPTIGVISRIVKAVRPTMIYTHSLHDVHQDHRNTHRAALVAVRKVGRVYCFQSPSATVDFRPTRFVAIDEQLDRKLQAIGAFASQVEIRAYLEPDLIESTARYWSRYCDGRYAEPFEVVREAAVEGQRDLAPAKGIVRGENGAGPAAPDRRAGRPPREGQQREEEAGDEPGENGPSRVREHARQQAAELTRGVPDGAT